MPFRFFKIAQTGERKSTLEAHMTENAEMLKRRLNKLCDVLLDLRAR